MTTHEGERLKREIERLKRRLETPRNEKEVVETAQAIRRIEAKIMAWERPR